MDIDLGRLVFGCALTLLLGPALWAPSLFNWRFRAETRRVRDLSNLIGPTGARFTYVGIGAIVSLIGLWFVATAFSSSGSVPQASAVAPTQVLTGFDSAESRGLAFSPDGAKLLAAGWGLQLWSPATGAALETIPLHELKGPKLKHVTALSASPQGEWIALGFGDGTIYAQDGAVGRLRWDNLRQCEFIPVPFSVGSVAITPDGLYALAVGLTSFGRNLPPQTVHWIDFQQKEVRELTQLVHAAHVAMQGTTNLAVVAHQHARLTIVDMPTGEVVAEISSPEEPRGECSALAVSPDGQYAVTCHANNGDQSVRVWNLKERTFTSRFTMRDTQGTTAASTQANRFATGSGMTRPEVTLWDMHSGEKVRVYGAQQDKRLGVRSLAFSPQGDRIAAASGDTCYVWDVVQP